MVKEIRIGDEFCTKCQVKLPITYRHLECRECRTHKCLDCDKMLTDGRVRCTRCKPKHVTRSNDMGQSISQDCMKNKAARERYRAGK